jgi:hypothetical protein
LGLAHAYRGDSAAAVREAARGMALLERAGDAFVEPMARAVVARTYLAAGAHGRALDELEALLRAPSPLSPAWLRVDPEFAPLQGNPRFQRLAQGRW